VASFWAFLKLHIRGDLKLGKREWLDQETLELIKQATSSDALMDLEREVPHVADFKEEVRGRYHHATSLR